jgi:hypothetical protein
MKNENYVLFKDTLSELIKNNKYMCTSDNTNYMEITELKDNKLSICPQGGGFVKSIDINNQSFIDDVRNEKIKFTNSFPMKWKKVKLYHDHWVEGNHYIEGYVTNHKWNGWSMPKIELDQVVKFNKIQSLTDCDYEHSIFRIGNDENKIYIVDFNEGDETIVESELINIDGKNLKVFDVSLGWTWSEEEINPKKG